MTTQTTRSIKIRRHFNAPRKKVFSAWMDAAVLKKWHAPSKDYTVIIEELDAKLGGRYRINMQERDGTDHILTGVYEQVENPELLQFSWGWDDDDRFGENKVTLKFEETNGETTMDMTHEFFPTAELMDKHEKGWNSILDRLEKVL